MHDMLFHISKPTAVTCTVNSDTALREKRGLTWCVDGRDPSVGRAFVRRAGGLSSEQHLCGPTAGEQSTLFPNLETGSDLILPEGVLPGTRGVAQVVTVGLPGVHRPP